MPRATADGRIVSTTEATIGPIAVGSRRISSLPLAARDRARRSSVIPCSGPAVASMGWRARLARAVVRVEGRGRALAQAAVVGPLLHDLQPAHDRVQRVAQLVRQLGQELVFQAVRVLRRGPRFLVALETLGELG